MARIKLIVTGDMEKLALHKSLRRFFPYERDGQKVTWEQPSKNSVCNQSPVIAQSGTFWPYERVGQGYDC
jgi:hypothetical protein